MLDRARRLSSGLSLFSSGVGFCTASDVTPFALFVSCGLAESWLGHCTLGDNNPWEAARAICPKTCARFWRRSWAVLRLSFACTLGLASFNKGGAVKACSANLTDGLVRGQTVVG